MPLDERLLTEFYRSRGYADMRVQAIAPEIARERDAFFITFNIQEGPRYRFGQINTISEVPGVDAAAFAAQNRVRRGEVYNPATIENTIRRMETVALQAGLNFLNIEPRVTRNPSNQTLDLTFALTRGERVFVERIDIEGNTTTLDEVIRRQFGTVEGDPFNPREIRNSAERIRALGYFADAQVETRQGSGPDQVIVGVNVEEQPTGSLTLRRVLWRQLGRRPECRAERAELPRPWPVARRPSLDRQRRPHRRDQLCRTLLPGSQPSAWLRAQLQRDRKPERGLRYPLAQLPPVAGVSGLAEWPVGGALSHLGRATEQRQR